MPHPNKLPGLYWVGEAFSSVQGWIEGALETAEMACKAMHSPPRRWRFKPEKKKGEVVVEGRAKRERISRVHPGSRQAIEKYMGRDATKVFEHIHPHYSWSIVYAMQKK